MTQVCSGSYLEKGDNQNGFLVEWVKLDALSEEFFEKMTSLASLGMECFREVEIEFLKAYPDAMKEDQSLSGFLGLTGTELEDSMNEKLYRMFHCKSSDLSEGMRSYMAEAYYYFVTIKDETSGKIVGFITFMSGGPVPSEAFKITVLAVDKNYRRKGLAGFLINSLKNIGLMPKRVCASTRPSNLAANRTYKKWGFVEDIDAQKNAGSHFIKGHWVHFVSP